MSFWGWFISVVIVTQIVLFLMRKGITANVIIAVGLLIFSILFLIALTWLKK